MVDFTRQLSSAYVSPQRPLTVTYRVRNTGNVPLSDLQLSDSLGGFAARLDALEVGESRAFVSHVSLTADDASRAALSYAEIGRASCRERV